MKVVGVVIIVLALVIAVLPQFNNCKYEGAMITLPNGKTIPMKCYWSAQSSLIAGIPMAFAGLFIMLSRKKETQRALAAIVALLGAFSMALPTVLIGVCLDMSKEPLCALVMKPALIAAGALSVVAAIVVAVLAGKSEDSAPPSEGAAA